MRKIAPLVASVTIILVASLFAGLGTMALFTDTEVSEGNPFTAGTLDLKVNGEDDPNVFRIEVGPIYPGWSKEYRWTLKNDGNLDGILWFEIDNVVNADNGVTEPEIGSPGEDGTETGELGEHLLHKMNFFKPGTYHENSRPRIESQTGSNIDHWISLNSVENLKLYYENNLGAGEEKDLCIVFTVDKDVGNCIQGDSVEFNIIFRLVQV